jgi:RNA polymerase-interacting CarD/CdnL/TRCF family regulator
MNFKKISQITFFIFCLTIATNSKALSVKNENNNISVVIKEEEPSEHAKALLMRLFEIKNMDKEALSSSEKKALRKELRGMKKEMKAANTLDSKVYISVGAIIIILLLILILR